MFPDFGLACSLPSAYFSVSDVRHDPGIGIYFQYPNFILHSVFLQMRAEQIKIGDAFDETSRLGPLINKQQYEKVMGYIQVGQ